MKPNSQKILALTAAALLLQACPKEMPPPIPSPPPAELALRCDDAAGTLFKARDEAQPEGERLKLYVDLYLSLLDRKTKLDAAIAQNPDVVYAPQEGAQTLLDNQETCARQVTDLRLETERFIRDLADTPTVHEIKGGNITVTPRVDFEILRRAIGAIEMDGKQELLRSIDNAEQTLGPVQSAPPSRRR